MDKGEIIPLAPELDIDDIELLINDAPAKVFTISKVEEFGGDFKLNGYFITTQRPIQMSFDEYTKLTIKVKDKVSEEIGEAVLYW